MAGDFSGHFSSEFFGATMLIELIAKTVALQQSTLLTTASYLQSYHHRTNAGLSNGGGAFCHKPPIIPIANQPAIPIEARHLKHVVPATVVARVWPVEAVRQANSARRRSGLEGSWFLPILSSLMTFASPASAFDQVAAV